MKAFVVGNIAIDETFAVTRLPREGELIFGAKVSTDLGGKGANQAVILARSGIETVLIAAVGVDLQAERMRGILAEEKVILRLTENADLESDRSIVVKEAAGGNANITTVECARSLDFEDIHRRMTDADPGDLIVLQGNLRLDTTQRMIAASRARGLHVVLNPSPLQAGVEALLPQVDTLFLNQHEAFQITGSHADAAVRDLLEFGIETVILSRGEKGSIIGTAQDIRAVLAIRCRVVDSTGAGDTLQGVALADASLRGSGLDVRAMERATKAAALTVSRSGTTTAFPTESELTQLLRS